MNTIREKLLVRWKSLELTRSDWAALAICLIFTITFSVLLVRKHNGFETRALDLAKFDQAIWNTAHGRPFHISLAQTLVIESHFSPSLALYAPLYWIWADVRLLFVLQVIFMTLTGGLIYWHLRDGRPWLGVVVMTALFASPFTHQVLLVEFRRLSLAIFATAGVLYALLHRRYRWMSLGLLVLLLTKEDLTFFVISVGIYLILVQRAYGLGIFWMALGLLMLFLVPLVILPTLSNTEHYTHGVGNFAYLGESAKEIVITAVTQPRLVLRMMLQPSRLRVLFRFLWPTLGLFVLAPEVALFMVPFFGYMLASRHSGLGELRRWYPSVPLVILYWAVGMGARRLPRRWSRIAAGGLIVAGVLSWGLYSEMWPGPQFVATFYTVTAHDRSVERAVRKIPHDVIVAAQDQLVPHLSHREYVFLFPWIPEDKPPDYLVLDRDYGYYPLTPDAYWERFYELLAGTEYAIETQIDHFYLFRPVPSVTPAISRHDVWDQGITLTGYETAFNTEQGAFQITEGLSDDQRMLRVWLYWRIDEPLERNYSVFVHLVGGDGAFLGQHDGWFVEGTRATSLIPQGTTLRDVRYITLPASRALEDFTLRVGLYDVETEARLHLGDGAEYLLLPVEAP